MRLIDYFLLWTAIAFLSSPIGASAAEHVHLEQRVLRPAPSARPTGLRQLLSA